MFRKLFVFCLLLCTLPGVSQEQNAAYYYNEASKAFIGNNLERADSLYTLSLRYQPDAATYFNRAITRQKLGRRKEYPIDLAYAAGLGDQDAYALLRKEFAKVDTLHSSTKILNGGDSVVHKFYYVTYSNEGAEEVLDSKFNAHNQLINVMWYTPRLQIDIMGEEQAEFTGGLRGMMTYIQYNVHYPPRARENDISGKVFLKFVVMRSGAIERIELLKGVAGCSECDEEAIRVVTAMPRWKPARLNGRPVNCYFTLPITFKIN